MFFKKKKVKENFENKEENISTLPYDQEFKINKLKLFVVIVNRDQGDFFVKKFEEVGVGASFEIYGRGTATKEIYEILGVGETKTDILLSFVSEKDISKVKEIVLNRFNVSKNAKGIAFSIAIDSLAGILIYKYLTNTRQNERRPSHGKPKKL